MAVYRLRQLRSELEGRVRILAKALSLELKNERPTPKNVVDLEIPLMAQQEVDLPIGPWRSPEWQYPATILPAFEALVCAAEQGNPAASEFGWRVRRAFFGESRCISMRHVLLEIAAESGLDVECFARAWDTGNARATVIAESHHGWEVLKVAGSPTFVLPSGEQAHNPGASRVTWGPNYTVRKLEPPQQPWREAYAAMISRAVDACRAPQ